MVGPKGHTGCDPCPEGPSSPPLSPHLLCTQSSLKAPAPRGPDTARSWPEMPFFHLFSSYSRMGVPSLVPLLYLTCVTVHIPAVVLLFWGTPPAKLPADGLSGSFLSPSLSRLIHSIKVLKLHLQPGLPCNGYYP